MCSLVNIGRDSNFLHCSSRERVIFKTVLIVYDIFFLIGYAIHVHFTTSQIRKKKLFISDEELGREKQTDIFNSSTHSNLKLQSSSASTTSSLSTASINATSPSTSTSPDHFPYLPSTLISSNSIIDNSNLNNFDMSEQNNKLACSDDSMNDNLSSQTYNDKKRNNIKSYYCNSSSTSTPRLYLSEQIRVVFSNRGPINIAKSHVMNEWPHPKYNPI